MSSFTSFFALIAALFTMIFAPGKTFEKQEILTVMTFNIYYDNLTETRLESVLGQIKSVMPDSFGLQELKNTSNDYFKANLKEYRYEVVSDESGSRVQYNGIFWLDNKFTRVDGGHIFLSTTPDKPSTGWGAKHRRMLQWVVLEDKETGFRYVHANTHLDNKGEESRNESARMINETLGKMSYPVVLTGDFNTYETDDCIQSLLANGWKNTMTLSGVASSTGTYHGCINADLATTPIDFIFVKGAKQASDWKVHREKNGNNYISDHYAVSTSLTFNFNVSAKKNYEMLKNS